MRTVTLFLEGITHPFHGSETPSWNKGPRKASIQTKLCMQRDLNKGQLYMDALSCTVDATSREKKHPGWVKGLDKAALGGRHGGGGTIPEEDQRVRSQERTWAGSSELHRFLETQKLSKRGLLWFIVNKQNRGTLQPTACLLADKSN